MIRKLTLLAVALLFTGASPAPLVKIQLALNWKAEPEFGGFYEAKLTGLDEKEGVKLEVITGGAGQPVAQMVAAKQVDFGIVSGDEVILAQDRGADVVAFFAVYQTNPLGIMVHEELGVNSLEELFKKGATLAVQKGLPFFAHLSKKYDLSKMEFVPYIGGIGPFLADSNFAQQCFVTAEPVLAKREKVKTRSFLLSETGYNPYQTVVVTRREIIEKDPARVAAVLRVFQSGWAAYLKSPEATNRAMAKLNPAMDLATFTEVSQIQKKLIETKETRKSGLGSMTLVRWMNLQNLLFDLKLIKSKRAVAEFIWAPVVPGVPVKPKL